MVSKVAVIALVAIIAVPILVGYGLNFETESYSYYSATGSETNVTPLLQNSTTYNYANANPYSLNADVLSNNNHTWVTDTPSHFMPRYQSFITTPTSMALDTGVLGAGDTFSSVYLLQIDNRGDGRDSTLTTTVQYTHNGATQTRTIYHTTIISYDKSDDILYIDGSYETATANPNTYSFPNPISTAYSGSVGADAYIVRSTSATNKYVDITAGWTIPGGVPNVRTYLTPAPAQNMLLTMNLDTVDNSEYQIYFDVFGENHPGGANRTRIVLDRVVDGSAVSWYAYNGSAPVSSRVQIPYNPSVSNNTIQLNFTRAGCDLRYIGSWQNTIGEANYYWSNSFSWGAWVFPETKYITGFVIGTPGFSASGAVFRVDAANVLATTLPVILDNTYDPVYSTNHTNPATTIKDVQKYGTSFAFGGQTFNVTNGTFTIGTSNPIPVDGMKLDSIPDGNGNYDNRINGTKISTTATPSAITFNGQWRANVSTVSQEEVIKADTHWVAGKFAWQGLDDNFLMVGLLTSAAAFVGLAMYGRKSGAKVGALLLVCGGAAFMFILMM